MLRRIGATLYGNDGKVIPYLYGFNDSIVVPGGMIDDAVHFRNRLIWNADDKESIDYNPTASIRKFWWDYFSVARAYGFNLVRLGGQDSWSLNKMYRAWFTKRDQTIAWMTDMLDCAWNNGIYVCFEFGQGDPAWTFSRTAPSYGLKTSVSAPMAGDLYTPGSEAWNEWLGWLSDVMDTFKDHPGLGMWEFGNEPDSDGIYGSYWQPMGADAKPAFNAWLRAVAHDVAALDHSHLHCVGSAGGLFMNPAAWPTTAAKANFMFLNDAPELDLCSLHGYGGGIETGGGSGCQSANEGIACRKAWATELGKPLFVSELGKNRLTTDAEPYAPYGYSRTEGDRQWIAEQWFWPRMSDLYISQGISVAIMQITDYPYGEHTRVATTALGVPIKYYGPARVGIPSVAPIYPIDGTGVPQSIRAAIQSVIPRGPNLTAAPNYLPYLLVGGAFIGAMIYLTLRPTPTPH